MCIKTKLMSNLRRFVVINVANLGNLLNKKAEPYDLDFSFSNIIYDC